MTSGRTPVRRRRLSSIVAGMVLMLTMVATGLVPATASDAGGQDSKSQPAEADAVAALQDGDVVEMPTEPIGPTPCVQGRAGPFPCHQIDLLNFWPTSEYGGGPNSQFGGPGNVIWGWEDSETGKEWALLGRANGVAFIDITQPRKPVYVANLPTQTGSTLWRDVRTYADHAFVVSEAAQHGMQVFDMTRLRDIDYADAPVNVTPDAHYDGFGNAHTLAINEETGFAYPVGTGVNVRPGVPNVCSRSLHMVDIRDPKNPTFAGCFQEQLPPGAPAGQAYTHETTCVIYRGPDERYQGREICFLANPEPRNTDPGVHSSGLAGRVLVVDVTDKFNPQLLSWAFIGWPYGYSHQGWPTDDHRYLLHQDELDQQRVIGGEMVRGNTRMRIFDISDLENIQLHSVYRGETAASAHNIYVKNRYAYLANYFDGLRILDITKLDHPGSAPHPESPDAVEATGVREVACFDVDPARNDVTGFGAAWDNYPYFRNGVVGISSFDGFFLVKPRLGGNAAFPDVIGNIPPKGQGNDNRGGGSFGCTGVRGGGGGPGNPHDPGH